MHSGADNTAAELRQVWDANAEYWDAAIGEGHAWVEELIWPATLRLLEPSPGARILDIGCGNGLYSRKLAAMNISVVAFDFSSEMIRLARARTADAAAITYQVLDATNATDMLSAGLGMFDAAIAQMVLFDMHDVSALACSLARLLKPNGYLVATVAHPCFNSARFARVTETVEDDGGAVTEHSLRLFEYITPRKYQTSGLSGQPALQSIFHRPLCELLAPFFSAGFVLDGLLEPCFHYAGSPEKCEATWRSGLVEFPPVLTFRLRLLRGSL